MSNQIQSLKLMIANVCTLMIVALSLIYIGACLFAYLYSNRMIFPIPTSSYQDDRSIIKLETTAGDSISLQYFPAAPTSPLLIYSHGNGEDLGDTRAISSDYQTRGIAVLSYDYPGYGTSSGTPSEEGCYAAIEAAFIYAVGKLGYSPKQIILYGRSLGSGPSTWLAERQEVAGLILDGAFSSTFRVMTRIKILPFDRFDNFRRLPKINIPILMIHGKNDRIVPFAHAQKNMSAIKQNAETLWVSQAGHNDLIQVAGNLYWERTTDFIKTNTKNE